MKSCQRRRGSMDCHQVRVARRRLRGEDPFEILNRAIGAHCLAYLRRNARPGAAYGVRRRHGNPAICQRVGPADACV